MNLDLDEKIVLVTGGTSGIGLAIVKSFLEENASVIVLARNEEKILIQKTNLQNFVLKKKVFFFKCDCEKLSEVKRTHAKVISKFGKIEVLINNIGSGRGTSNVIPEISEWKKVWKKNFTSAYNVVSVFIKDVIKKKGSIIFINSIAGKEFLDAPTAYSTSKTALLTFSKTLSLKYGNIIRVNTISPGNIFSPGGTWDKKIKKDKAFVKKYIQSNVPANRFGCPEEIAYLALFLSSSKASFINGSNIVIDGGQTKSFL